MMSRAVCVYNTSFLRRIFILGMHLDHHRAGRFLLLHYGRVIRAIGEHRLVVVILIELKAQEKRTAISADVGGGEDEGEDEALLPERYVRGINR